jgi:hypothetical protein
LKLHDGVSTETREITIVASQLRPVTAPEEAPPEDGGTTAVLDAGPHQDTAGGAESSPAKDTAPVRQSGWNRESAPNVGLDELLGGASPRRKREDAAAGPRNERESDQPERQPSKPKRSSVPSWDEIVFGPRGD